MKSRLIKLDAAARRLGCHIETLRLRIRSGRLKAYRGPHGAYYIRVESLGALLARRLPRPPEPSSEDLDKAWRKACRRLREQLVYGHLDDEPANAPLEERRETKRIDKGSAAAWRLRSGRVAYEMVEPFLRALVARPTVGLGAYHLLCAQGLAELGYAAQQIAKLLGLSDRHARRLVRQRELARPVLRAAHGWALREARRLVAELRSQLQAEGFRFHRRVSWGLGPPVHPDRPRPAFRVRKLTRDEALALRRAGLTSEQVWAITVVGLGSDELNEFLLRT